MIGLEISTVEMQTGVILPAVKPPEKAFGADLPPSLPEP